MAAGTLTARALVEIYCTRIEALDRAGPRINAVIELNPDARRIAGELDRERRERGPRGPLHGIPILLKDNIETGDAMLTTAGSLALAGAPAVAVDRNPSGSSSGSAAAVAAGFCAAALGTETNGSIVSPSNACGVVGIKPTVGLASRAGVVPIAPTHDTVGAHARTVADAAAVLGALVGVDPADLPSAGALKADRLELEVLLWEFKADLEAYLASRPGVGLRTLDDLIAFNRRHADRELVYFGQELFEVARPSRPASSRASPSASPSWAGRGRSRC